MSTTTIIALAITIILAVILGWKYVPSKFKAPLIVTAAFLLYILGNLFRQATRPNDRPNPETLDSAQVEELEAVLDRRTEKEITVLVAATEAQDFQALDEALNHDIRRR